MSSTNEQLEKLFVPNIEQPDGRTVTTPENEERKTEWSTIYVTAGLAFSTAMQFSLYFSSLWPFLQIIDPEIRTDFFGYVVAIYSLGQIIASPLVGYWSNRIKQIRLPLYTNIALMFVGNFIYLSLEILPAHRKQWLLFGRFITGFGSSNISLLKAYTTTATLASDRSRGIAYVTGAVTVGMILGPAFQLAFVGLDYPGYSLPFKYQLHLYSAPAYGACLSNILCLLIVRFLFRESEVGLMTETTVRIRRKSSLICVQDTGNKVKLPPYDFVAIAVCYLTRFTQIFVHTNIETLSAPLSMAIFAWSRHDVVEYIAISQAAMSGLALLIYFLFIVFKADRFLSFRLCCVLALGGLACFYLITFSYPFLPHSIKTFHHNGCDSDRYSWCFDFKYVNVFLYYAAYIFFVGISFSSINICLNTLFSKVIGPRRQAFQQGCLQVSGGVARMIGPILVSYVFLKYGPRFVYIIVLSVIFINLSLFILCYKRMVPLRISDDSTTYDQLSADDDAKSKQTEEQEA
ncbi:hypothetical protein M3Y94_00756600 [Aphelenchoides besseyi]|nr:hypothetical protein M3Y94_00756600 [Aphelenchoides besseyi]